MADHENLLPKQAKGVGWFYNTINLSATNELDTGTGQTFLEVLGKVFWTCTSIIKTIEKAAKLFT